MRNIHPILFLPFMIATTHTLFCALYDYSQTTVKCVNTCPAATTNIDNKCLTSRQYIYQGEVFVCEGYVSTDHTLCCPPNNYIQNNQCLPCFGIIFNNGLSCCKYDHYLDMSQNTPNCLPLSTGPCSTTLKLNSLFKVCCPTGQMYYPPAIQCVQPNSYNCDSTEKVCCGLGQKMEYIRG